MGKIIHLRVDQNNIIHVCFKTIANKILWVFIFVLVPKIEQRWHAVHDKNI